MNKPIPVIRPEDKPPIEPPKPTPTKRTLDLRNLPDAERNERVSGAVAEHVVKLPKVGPEWGTGPKYWYRIGPAMNPKDDLMQTVPPYATSADAVLPLLGKHYAWQVCNLAYGHGIRVGIATEAHCAELCDDITLDPFSSTAGKSKSVALSACIALLRAEGIEVLT